MKALQGRVWWVSLLFLVAGCAPSPARWKPPHWREPPPLYAPISAPWRPVVPPPPPVVPPSPVVRPLPLVRVALEGLVIAPAKLSGDCWDLFYCTVAASDVRSVTKALGASSPASAAIAAVGMLAAGGKKLPDVGGTASLLFDGLQGNLPLRENEDTLMPQWQNVAWTLVPLDGRARLHVVVIDVDVSEHDPMGTFEINATHMIAALDAAQIYPVRVDDQTGGQILFAQITVREDSAP